MTAPDPLSVVCPDCMAGVTVPCTTTTDAPHPARVERAEVQTTRETGTCTHPTRAGTPCGRPLIRYQIHGETRVIHPTGIAEDCPPFPDPRLDWNAYAHMLQRGLEPQKPPVDAWQPLTGTETHP